MSKQSILVVGIGNMGSALIRGLCKSSSFEGRKIFAFDINKTYDTNIANGKEKLSFIDNLSVAPEMDAIILCTKPQDLGSVASLLTKPFKPNCLLISIAAGVTIEDFKDIFRFDGAIVRTMPNIAATVGCAATAMCCNDKCDEQHKKIAEDIFNAIGEAYWTKESLLDAVTGLSGSGPAYIYMVIEALTDGGVKMGLPRSLAGKLAAQTVLGSAMLVKSTGLHPAILKDQVTTPGGTTICAIHELEAHGLRSMLISAVATATERSALLRKVFKK